MNVRSQTPKRVTKPTPPSSETSVVVLKDVQHWNGARHVLRGVDLSVDSNELLLVKGANGAGKSTLFRLLAGIHAPDRGEVSVLGASATSRKAYQKLSFVPDRALLFPRLSVREHLKYAAGIRCLRDGYDVGIDILGRLGAVSHLDDSGSDLSHGTQRKVALALGLLNDSSVILLDEPFAGLDTEAAQELSTILNEMMDSGKTVILSSHQEYHLLRLNIVTETVLVEGRLT